MNGLKWQKDRKKRHKNIGKPERPKFSVCIQGKIKQMKEEKNKINEQKSWRMFP